MRARWVSSLAVLLLVPSVSAEWGAYGEDGWPVNVDGESTNPYGRPASALGPLNEVLGVTVYPYWPILTAEVQRLALEHPDTVRLHSIGKSTIGLDLWMLEIADFANPDKVPLETREVLWVDGGTHSNEYSGVYFVTHLAAFLTDGYGVNETATWIVENRHTWLLPMVNPDGSNLFGRLNAHLVNINRNYPVDWGALAEDPVLNNPGPHPASELETRLNIEWFNKTRPDYYASIHCCGNLWLYPYGVEGLDPLDNATFARICAEAYPTVVEDCGPIWSTIYPASGSSVDTVYEYTGAAAFGIEMSGRGAVALWGQPFTNAAVEEQEVESWKGVLHAFLHVEKYGGLPRIGALSMTPAGLSVEISNDGYGPVPDMVVTLDGHPPVHVDEPLLPGETTTVTIPGAVEAGERAFTIDYAKRVQAAPRGLVDLVMTFEAVEGTGSLRVSVRPNAAGGAPIADGVLEVPTGSSGLTPGVPVLAVGILLFALAGLLRRR